MHTLRKQLNTVLDPVKRLAISPPVLLLLTTTLALLYTLSEGIFLFTRPSFLRTVPFAEKLEALSATSALLVLAGVLAVVILLIPGFFVRNPSARRVIAAVALLVPTLIITALLLLLVDNFTYTVFRFGIVSTQGAWRTIYALILVVVALYLFTRLADLGNLLTVFFNRLNPRARLILPAAIILLAGLGVLLPANLSQVKNETLVQRTASSRNQLPDILLITVDGVNAEYTSVYSGERDTTPFLSELATHSLVGLNHFSNAQGTIGSLTSLLTGKYPAETRVIYSSDMLRATDAYLHLPGILKSYGYYTAQFSNAVYADAYKTNFQNAFDEANGRSMSKHPVTRLLTSLYPGVTSIFQQEVIERITDRLGHLLHIRDMANPYQQVTEAPTKFDDEEKIERTISLLEGKREPVFIHLHWMGTHGPNYFPDQQVFSAGLASDDQGSNKQLFYYDSILEFDKEISGLYQYLLEHNRLDHTILIVTSDHSQKWTNSRLPLIVHFPENEHTGEVLNNTENIDIAPTLLDYLGINQPDWMPGQSLVTPGYQSHPIFTAKIPKSTKDPATGKVVYPESKPPFYQFGRISVVWCDQWFEIDLNELTLSSGQVVGSDTKCSARISKTEAIDMIIKHMEEHGFDTMSLVPMRK